MHGRPGLDGLHSSTRHRQRQPAGLHRHSGEAQVGRRRSPLGASDRSGPAEAPACPLPLILPSRIPFDPWQGWYKQRGDPTGKGAAFWNSYPLLAPPGLPYTLPLGTGEPAPSYDIEQLTRIYNTAPGKTVRRRCGEVVAWPVPACLVHWRLQLCRCACPLTTSCAQADPDLISLMHQLITAKLNVLWGALPSPFVIDGEITTAIAAADKAIGARFVNCATLPCKVYDSSAQLDSLYDEPVNVMVGLETPTAEVSVSLITLLDAFNKGCPACEDVGGLTLCTPSDCGSKVPRHCNSLDQKARMLAGCHVNQRCIYADENQTPVPADIFNAWPDSTKTACCLRKFKPPLPSTP